MKKPIKPIRSVKPTLGREKTKEYLKKLKNKRKTRIYQRKNKKIWRELERTYKGGCIFRK